MAAPPRVIQVLPVVLILFVVYLVYVTATSGRNAKRNEAVQAQKDADWHSERTAQLALVDSLDTPKAFQARCGRASSTVNGIPAADDRDLSASRHGAITLIYRTPPSEIHAIFTRDKDFPIVLREHLREKTFALTPYEGLVTMGCVKK